MPNIDIDAQNANSLLESKILSPNQSPFSSPTSFATHGTASKRYEPATWNPYSEVPTLPKFDEDLFIQDVISGKCVDSELLSALPLSGLSGTKRNRLAQLYQVQ